MRLVALGALMGDGGRVMKAAPVVGCGVGGVRSPWEKARQRGRLLQGWGCGGRHPRWFLLWSHSG